MSRSLTEAAFLSKTLRPQLRMALVVKVAPGSPASSLFLSSLNSLPPLRRLLLRRLLRLLWPLLQLLLPTLSFSRSVVKPH
jgi:hypothetical protein